MTTVSQAQSTRRAPLPAGDAFQLVPASVGDHPLINHLLHESLSGPSLQEYQAELEDPHYAPEHRLLVKNQGRIVAHVRVSYREMKYGGRTLPVALIDQLATLPEHRGLGLARALLDQAEQNAIEAGASLAMLSTTEPIIFRKRGWTTAAMNCYSRANAREILASLHDTQTEKPTHVVPGQKQPADESLTIRLWRHVEQAALMRMYADNTAESYGPLVRSEDYWRWLISRRAYDRIYVAIEGPNKLDLCDDWDAIIGYAVMSEGRILELMTGRHVPPTKRRDAARQLLARACGDAIETDQHTVRLDAPIGQPLHEILAASGRFVQTDNDGGHVQMMKLFRPLNFLDSIRGELYARARGADLGQPCELGLLVGGEKYRLEQRSRSVQITKGKVSRSYLELTGQQLGQLCLGCLDVRHAIATQQIAASTRVAIDTAAVLFPQLPIWRPAWDELWV
jgi:predicted N-acetyltransferase YhbS